MGVDHAHIGLSVEDGDRFFQGSGSEAIVAVYPAEVRGSGVGDRAFKSRGDALMGGSVDANARVAFRVVLGNVEGGVGGAVVPNEKLKVRVGLSEDAFDRFSEVAIAVVTRDD